MRQATCRSNKTDLIDFMRKFPRVLVGVFLTLTTGCRTVETAYVEAPQVGVVSGGTYKLFEQEREVQVHYPKGVRAQPIKLHFTENDGILSVGVDRNSPFVVQQMELIKLDSKKIHRVYLQRNHFVLPTFTQPSRQEFDSKTVFRGIGRILARGVKGLDPASGNGGLCNGVLVKQDQVLTASHCIATQLECDNSRFIIWDGASYADYSCKQVLLTKRGSDQSLILLQGAVHKMFSPVPTERDEWYFADETPLFVGSDFSEWSLKKGLIREKLELKKDTGNKSLTPCKVKGSFYSVYSVNGSEIASGIPPSERVGESKRLTNYAVSCEVVLGQSGSGVYGLKGTLVGLVVASESRFTPLDPEIAMLLR